MGRPLTPEAPGEAVGRATAIIDAAGRVRAVSGAFTAALRVRRDELLAQPLSAVVRREDRPTVAHALQAVASGEWPGCALEVRFLQHGGSERLVRLTLAPDGPQRVRAHATDLSSEEEATRTLLQYERGLTALTAHALDIWAVLDEHGSMRSVSASVATHLGWTAKELDGRALRDFAHPEDHARLATLLAELKADPSAVRTFMFRARHRDGQWRTLESTTSGFNPEVLGNSVFVLNARDVTARERTEAALREVEHRFGQLVEQALAGIVVIQQGRIAYANPRFLDLAGLDAGALASRPRVVPLIDRASIPAVREVRAELAMGAAKSARVRLRGRRPSGQPLDLDVASSVVEFEGSPALLCTVTDVTDALALQVRMAQAEKVEAIGQLAGGVAHDFNNLLTGILAWVDIATEELGSANPIAHALDEIRSAAERAAELTRQLLAFGRRQRLDPGPLDPGEVVVRLKRWMDRVLGPAHPLLVDVPDAPWLIDADRTLIERALTALIMNAQDALPGGGEIRVSVAHEQCETDRVEAYGQLTAGDYVVVSVSDRGTGMDATTRRRIFEPFFTTKPQGRGTGLGLPAVLGTVLQSGGALDVLSSEGQGTQFRLYFPRRTDLVPDPAGEAGVQARPPRVTPRNVLVVEPDRELRGVLKRALRKAGHHARAAATAAEAESLASHEAADVVVCDLDLRGVHG
ncbi:MAG: PAS domain S-box protein, partial [Gemmatimonadota bacterium]|nr:PAS domain S-box protein [Gemmatimonadota bacterium]